MKNLFFFHLIKILINIIQKQGKKIRSYKILRSLFYNDYKINLEKIIKQLIIPNNIIKIKNQIILKKIKSTKYAHFIFNWLLNELRKKNKIEKNIYKEYIMILNKDSNIWKFRQNLINILKNNKINNLKKKSIKNYTNIKNIYSKAFLYS